MSSAFDCESLGVKAPSRAAADACFAALPLPLPLPLPLRLPLGLLRFKLAGMVLTRMDSTNMGMTRVVLTRMALTSELRWWRVGGKVLQAGVVFHGEGSYFLASPWPCSSVITHGCLAVAGGAMTRQAGTSLGLTAWALTALGLTRTVLTRVATVSTRAHRLVSFFVYFPS